MRSTSSRSTALARRGPRPKATRKGSSLFHARPETCGPELATRSAALILPLRRKPMGETLEPPRAPTRRRLDVDEYYKMAEAGILTDPHHVELIDGEIIDMAAIGSPHAAVTNTLARLFTRALRDETALVSVQS